MDTETKKTLLAVTHLSSVGIGMVAAIFGSLFLGIYLDKKFASEPYLAIILTLMGIIAGFRNFFRLVKKYGLSLSPLKAEKKDDTAPPGNSA